jgi:hypothetical protein
LKENHQIVIDLRNSRFQAQLSDAVKTFQDSHGKSLIDALPIRFKREVPFADLEFI